LQSFDASEPFGRTNRVLAIADAGDADQIPAPRAVTGASIAMKMNRPARAITVDPPVVGNPRGVPMTRLYIRLAALV
jgi:hypothetical protein